MASYIRSWLNICRHSSLVTRHFILLITFLLPSCGFSPIYATHPEAARIDLSSVDVLPVPGREGQLLKISLEDKLNPDSRRSYIQYRLNAAIKTETSPIAINPDGTAGRYRILITSPFSLTDAESGQVLFSDTLRQSVSYQVSEGDYSTYVASQDALRRGIEQLGEDYSSRIAAFLNRSLSRKNAL